MPILPANDPVSLVRALQTLKDGGVIGIPTETVYGLVADATNTQAVAVLYRLKNRENAKATQILVKNVNDAETLAELSDGARRLAGRFWPGALTMVLESRADNGLVASLSAGMGTIGLRCPAHAICQQLLEALPFPLAASSGNPSGEAPPVSAAELHAYFPELEVILDSGNSALGLSSTVVDATGKELLLLRQGTVGFEELKGCAES